MGSAASAALDRHAAERAGGAHVLSLVAGTPEATRTAWASWAASRACLTLLADGADMRETVDELLAQIPWMRSVVAARERFARGAGLTVDAVDAALDARSPAERREWVVNTAGVDEHVLVSGWLLCMLRDTPMHADAISDAPIQGSRLLSIMCDLASPIGVLLSTPVPTAEWLSRALATSHDLVGYMSRHALGIAAPQPLVEGLLSGAVPSAAHSLARQGIVVVPESFVVGEGGQGAEGHARSRAERRLYEALSRDRRTVGCFALNSRVPYGERELEIDLLAGTARFAVEIDGWYHFREPDGYRRDRVKDVMLQRAGYFVMRFLAEDVDDRLEFIVDEIAIGLAARQTAVAA
jgi:very-short-patch-repair endonuclease